MYVNTFVQNLNLQKDGTNINNQDRKELQIEKMLTFPQFYNLKSLGKIAVFKNCSQAFEAENFLKIF